MDARHSDRVGVDLGGTKIEAIRMAANGAIIERQRVPTPARDGYAAILEAVARLVDLIDPEQTLPVGLGHPGSIGEHGLLHNSNTQCLNGKPFRADLGARLGRPLWTANDANCLAVSEARDGAGAGVEVLFAVILGTGVGGGIALQGQSWSGLQGIAGEWGHNVLDDQGPHCYCGKRGCVETLLSGPALASQFEDETGIDGDGAQIAALAAKGDPGAQRVIDRYCERLARALAVVINILDPEVIVLGGGVSNVSQLYDAVPEKLSRYVFRDGPCRTPLRRAAHGDSSGVRGAAWLCDL